MNRPIANKDFKFFFISLAGSESVIRTNPQIYSETGSNDSSMMLPV